ncbi:hypothetical protein C9374_009583 [Naegleria lovaniensis]|uniref:Cytochrome b561 domain-containing protein n=1 Tax=Naegleria lovaniensis TaxID=51637 RepID=A0AA88KR44_NAELO|nr:uncharacterized protein C9374_009583 [Naegleria lovaniensis]KAG2393006.1 hypothetical protein C9374_009583 [Naegleria lovaniensis]
MFDFKTSPACLAETAVAAKTMSTSQRTMLNGNTKFHDIPTSSKQLSPSSMSSALSHSHRYHHHHSHSNLSLISSSSSTTRNLSYSLFYSFLCFIILSSITTTTLVNASSASALYFKSDLHTQLISNSNYVVLNQNPVFCFYWKKDSDILNGTIVSEIGLKAQNQQQKNIIAISLGVPDYIVAKSSYPLTPLVDVFVFDDFTAYDMFYKENNTDVTSFTTKDIFHRAKNDTLFGGTNNLKVTNTYEKEFEGDVIFKVVEFIRPKNTSDYSHDVLFPMKKNDRGIMFLNFAIWKTSIDSLDIFSNFEIDSSNTGYGWFEFQSIYYYPISTTLQALRIVHGILMIIGFTLLLIVSMLTVRHSQRFISKRKGVALHATLSIIAVVCILIAISLSIAACSISTNRHLDSIHKWIGLFVMIFIVLYQLPFSGPFTFVYNFIFIKKSASSRLPHSEESQRNNEEEEGESFLSKTENTKKIIGAIASFTHVWGGRLLIGAGCLNLYFGIHGIYAPYPWFIGISVFLALILLIALLAECVTPKQVKRLTKGKFKKLFGANTE